jgi:hypothetical protein
VSKLLESLEWKLLALYPAEWLDILEAVHLNLVLLDSDTCDVLSSLVVGRFEESEWALLVSVDHRYELLVSH